MACTLGRKVKFYWGISMTPYRGRVASDPYNKPGYYGNRVVDVEVYAVRGRQTGEWRKARGTYAVPVARLGCMPLARR